MCNMTLVSNVNPWNELTIFQPVTKKQKQKFNCKQKQEWHTVP